MALDTKQIDNFENLWAIAEEVSKERKKRRARPFRDLGPGSINRIIKIGEPFENSFCGTTRILKVQNVKEGHRKMKVMLRNIIT